MPEIPGFYSSEKRVWVIETQQGQTPLIAEAQRIARAGSSRHDSITAEMAGPVTKVQGERDEIGSLALLEASTKTMAQLERDDQTRGTLGFVHELQTKTEVVQERDDASPGYLASLLELATKTDTKRERDDQ
jgi:hypothetical protein